SEQMLGRAGVWRISVFEPPPSQTPNPKLQRNPGIETPKTKLQTPKKSQVPSSKPRPALRAWSLVFGVWDPVLLWCLEFGIWSFLPYPAPSTIWQTIGFILRP